ncbi:aminoglycoside phosphotransferase family protein [Actinoplanes sp. NPDC049802]|uniref:phosphotransferase enzyme family protein n=1 Tax=Actinoplanes sp. NPDC049802 TaxID=3154742 RepID=UPI0033CF2011
MTSAEVALLLRLCQRAVDPRAEIVMVHAGHNGTTVLRAATNAGPVIVKRHRSPDRHSQEVHAYRHWTSALRGRSARLIAAINDPPAIITSALPGRPLAEADLDPRQEADLHRQAGSLLSWLHHAEPPRPDPNMTAWLASRGDYWLSVAGPVIPRQRQAEIIVHLRELAQLGPIPAVPCHLDYTPKNLVVQPTGELAVIDFEHARYDLAARDLVRFANRVWPTRPDLKETFLQGYGSLDEVDRQVIEHCTHLDVLTTIARSAERSRIAEQFGRRSIRPVAPQN